ncbi:VOC family protein [Phenylobacterium terrae]|uniref:VOC family protein n=1 Tax=Phenylobacterium terrae TaxID=2665495 RepID=A0ABW4N4B1_9CAUL
MEKVVGVGGVFFRARDPQGLARWYEEHLGITGGEAIWSQAAGPTVFAPFKADSDYFPADKQWMMNFRVGDLDALLAQLRAAGIDAETRAEWDDPQVGRFARIHDPEGNPIELWEPAAGP